MVKISKLDKEWLVKNGYIKIVEGKYQGLVVCNKEHSSKSKTFYVEDRYARILNKN